MALPSVRYHSLERVMVTGLLERSRMFSCERGRSRERSLERKRFFSSSGSRGGRERGEGLSSSSFSFSSTFSSLPSGTGEQVALPGVRYHFTSVLLFLLSDWEERHKRFFGTVTFLF